MPITDAGNAACAGNIGQYLHAGFFKPPGEFRVIRLIMQSLVYKLLQGHFCGRLARAYRAFNFPLGRGAPLRLSAGRHLLQAVFPFQPPHDGLLPLVIPAVADHLALHADPVRQNVNVRVLGVGMLGHNVLAILEAHAFKVFPGNVLPLVVSELFIRRQADAHMTDGFGQIGAQGPHRAKLPRQLARIVAAHVGIEDMPLLLSQIVFQSAPKSLALTSFAIMGDPAQFPLYLAHGGKHLTQDGIRANGTAGVSEADKLVQVVGGPGKGAVGVPIDFRLHQTRQRAGERHVPQPVRDRQPHAIRVAPDGVQLGGVDAYADGAGAGLAGVAAGASALAAFASMRLHGKPREQPLAPQDKQFDRRENMACCKPKVAGSDTA